MIAGKDVAELLGPVAHRDFRGHADLFQFPLFEGTHVGAGGSRLGMKLEIEQRGRHELDGRKTLVELARGDEAPQQVVRQRLAGLVVTGELPQHLRLFLPVFVKLRGQLDEVRKNTGA